MEFNWKNYIFLQKTFHFSGTADGEYWMLSNHVKTYKNMEEKGPLTWNNRTGNIEKQDH